MPDLAVDLLGDRIHIATADPAPAIRRAEAILARAGIAAGSIRPIEPELEDLFISVLAGERQASG
jgi:ABC-2 type transport system ATP-binding protein